MRWKPVWVVTLLALLLAACATVAPEAERPEPTTGPAASVTGDRVAQEADTAADEEVARPTVTIEAIEQIDLSRVPDVDTSRHNVRLEEIIFDTFQPVNRTVPLPEAQPALIRNLRDAIPPLYEPNFAPVAETDEWLLGEDLVLGYADGGEAFAYPVKILNFHEMVSHRVNDRDILASYCPLCRSGIVYDRLLPGTEAPLLLGNTSALYESDMVMFDHQTGSYWNQVSGEAIVGPLTGQPLAILPAQMTTWRRWKVLYPETLALSEQTGFNRDYRRDPFSSYGERLNSGGRFFFPVSEAALDDRLEPAEVVLAVEVGEARRAYPLGQLGDAVVLDTVGQTAVVVFSRAEGPSGAAYLPMVGGRRLTFALDAGQIRDRETGSRWDMAGRAVEGELAGAQLAPVAARSTFWFSVAANYLEVDVYERGE